MSKQSYDRRYHGLRDYRDLWGKLLRDAERFEEDPSGDNLFNVMVTASSFGDWLVADLAGRLELHADLLGVAGKVNPDKKRNMANLPIALQLCHDVANASKHAVLTRKEPPHATAVEHYSGGYGEGPYGLGPYGGGEFYVIETDNEQRDASQVIGEVIAAYEAFLAKHNLL